MYLVQKVPNVYNKRMLAVKIGLLVSSCRRKHLFGNGIQASNL